MYLHIYIHDIYMCVYYIYVNINIYIYICILHIYVFSTYMYIYIYMLVQIARYLGLFPILDIRRVPKIAMD